MPSTMTGKSLRLTFKGDKVCNDRGDLTTAQAETFQEEQ